MRKLYLTVGAALCVFGTPAFATTGSFQAQGPLAGMALAIQSEMSGPVLVPGPHVAAILLAKNDSGNNGNGNNGNDNGNHAGKNDVAPGNSGSNGNDDHGKEQLAKCEIRTPSHPCKGNNGFGNGGDDGSPNGFPDGNR